MIRSDYGQTDRQTEFPLVKIKIRMSEFKHWRCNPPLESLRRLHSSNSSWFCKNSLPRFKTIWNTETQKMHQLILVPNKQNHHQDPTCQIGDTRFKKTFDSTLSSYFSFLQVYGNSVASMSNFKYIVRRQGFIFCLTYNNISSEHSLAIFLTF